MFFTNVSIIFPYFATFFSSKTIATEKNNKKCLRINSNSETLESPEIDYQNVGVLHVNMIIRPMN